MASNHSNDGDYQSLKSSERGRSAEIENGVRSLRRSKTKNPEQSENLQNYNQKDDAVLDKQIADHKLPESEAFRLRPKEKDQQPDLDNNGLPEADLPQDESEDSAAAGASIKEGKLQKKQKRAQKDLEVLTQDSWVTRNGHYLTYIGLYLFSIMVLYRPYELVDELGFLGSTAFFIALATIAIYIPTQLATEGNLTFLSFEVKMVLLLTFFALLSIPVAKSRMTAWQEFNDVFIKAVLMFIVMVNVLRTKKRLIGMIWLSLGIAIVLSLMALNLYLKGDLGVEGYRVGIDIGGMFGNPNDLALHLVMMTPLAVTFGLAAKSSLAKLFCFGITGLMVAGIMVTYSRGGFLGIICVAAFLVWKLGKENRIQVLAIAGVIGVIFIIAAPGNYGLRLLSIVIPGLDGVGSSDQRWELLKRSILVSARNPWGIGIGNFPIVGIRNLVSHNAYTQVSSEIGVFGFVAYVLFFFSPFRRLSAIERRLEKDSSGKWFYYVSIGLQASLIGYGVSSFFVSVAYGWFIYYLVAYAVAFRRIYAIEYDIEEDAKKFSLKRFVPGWQG